MKKLITANTPEELGLSGHLWGRKEVSELVNKQFAVKIPVRTMGHYLAKWNFTPQRPKKRLPPRPKSNQGVA